jgi:hypothetical protein
MISYQSGGAKPPCDRHVGTQTHRVRRALLSSVALAFAVPFLLGAFLGTVSGRFWLWSGLRTLLIALLTAGVILLVEKYSLNTA